MKDSPVPPSLSSSPARMPADDPFDNGDGRRCGSPPPSPVHSTWSSLAGSYPPSPESPRCANILSRNSVEDGSLPNATTTTTTTTVGIGKIPARRRPPPGVRSRGWGAVALRLFRSLLDLGVWTLFAVLVAVLFLHKMHDDFLYPHLELMVFKDADRDETEITYYHRECEREDFLALNATLEDLWVLPPTSSSSSSSIMNASDDGTNVAPEDDDDHDTYHDPPSPPLVSAKQYAQGAAEHMLIHGVSVYPDLLSERTARDLRTWIVDETERREDGGWHVQNGEHRVSWGFDMNDRHGGREILHQFWKDLATNNPYFVTALEAVVGPDPAVIEFAHITSEYGAINQGNHPDVSASESAARYARSFVPSYTLFLPLQDTTYEMGATHICPGSHLCGGESVELCEEFNVAMSGGRPREEGAGESDSAPGVWRAGWGALMNSQTMHRGMAHTDPDGLDRVLLSVTFAPRPNWNRPGKMDTRMLGLGSTYSILWDHWGHTFSDFLRADRRMTEPQKTLRSLGLIKANGWTHLTTTIMKMANKEIGYESDLNAYKRFLEDGGIPFLPQAWQGEFDETSDINVWHAFLLGTLKQTELELSRINVIVLVLYLSLCLAFDLVRLAYNRWMTRGRKRHQDGGEVVDERGDARAGPCSRVQSSFLRTLIRIFFGYGVIIVVAQIPVKMVNNSNWGKAIRSGKAYHTPPRPSESPPRSTLPHKTDILWTQRAYASTFMTSYSRVLDFGHPGNAYWKDVTGAYGDGYSALPPPLQRDFCDTLLDRIQRERRFLVQDTYRYWSRDIDPDALARHCHRELTMASDPLLRILLEQIDAIHGDIHYGFWSDMAIHERIIPAYLATWEQRLLPWSREGATSRTGVTSVTTKTTRGRIARTTRLRAGLGASGSPASQKRVTSGPVNDRLGRRRHSLPPVPLAKEPTPGAWLQEGDRVLALYECVDGNDWKLATITSAPAFDVAYNVVFDDGESDSSMEPWCIRHVE